MCNLFRTLKYATICGGVITGTTLVIGAVIKDRLDRTYDEGFKDGIECERKTYKFMEEDK